MKNFNKRNFHGHYRSKRRELAQHARTLTWIARIHSHTYINTVTIMLCKAPAQLLQNLKWNFYFEGNVHFCIVFNSCEICSL